MAEEDIATLLEPTGSMKAGRRVCAEVTVDVKVVLADVEFVVVRVLANALAGSAKPKTMNGLRTLEIPWMTY